MVIPASCNRLNKLINSFVQRDLNRLWLIQDKNFWLHPSPTSYFFTRRICPPDNSNGLRSNSILLKFRQELIFHVLKRSASSLILKILWTKKHIFKNCLIKESDFQQIEKPIYFLHCLFNILVYECRSNFDIINLTLPSVGTKKSFSNCKK